jgi:glucan 1,3-beta-glucosidase
VENVGGMVDVIELLNEPGGFLGSTWAAAIRQFWLDGYGAVRKAAGAGIKIMIGDAFLTVDVCCFIFICAFFFFLGC